MTFESKSGCVAPRSSRHIWSLVLTLGALVTLSAAPTAPTGLTAAVNGSTVVLSWRAVSSASRYQLEAGSAPSLANLAIITTSQTSYVAGGVADGTYFVRVRALDPSGWSVPSADLRVRVGCTSAPPAPTAYKASVSGAVVSLAWSAVSGATSYVLDAGSAPGVTNVASIPVATNSFVVPAPNGVYYTRIRAVNKCGASAPSAEVVVVVGQAPAPPRTPIPTPTSPTSPTAPIWGVVDPAILGTCTTAQHDVHVVSDRDGYRYRTWHPQVDPTGCIYAHEHGDNPAMVKHAEIAASPVRFGYVGRRHPMHGEPNGHEEPHEGFKVFVVNAGDVNDEGRVSRVHSRAVFHMGTGGPRRFNMPHHSAELRVIHPELRLKAFTQLMMNTGGVGAVCDPRKPAPVKDVVQLQSPCKLGSAYEIWSTVQTVTHQGREVYRAFATPAVFDPITVFNPTNPTELVYAWDARMAAVKAFPDTWSTHRGCDREGYAQPGYWYNAGGRTVYYTDAMGGELPETDPMALAQEISATDSIAAPATNDGLVQFKIRRSHCGHASKLGLKN